jgi:hypothetical protein
MKIAMQVTLDISKEGQEAYLLEFGIEQAELREDVKTAVTTLLYECAAGRVAEWDVTVR